jgi:hypothetical protein
MVYYKDIVEEYEDIEERYELALERIGQIPDETLVISPYKEYFNCVADFFIKIDKVLQHVKNNTMSDLTLEEHAEINKSLYQDVLGDNYNHSYCNAEYIAEHIFEKASADDMQVKISEKALNDEKIKLAQYMAFLYYEIRNQIGAVYEGRITDITLYAELFIEIYLLFQDEPDVKEIKEAVYYFENDYAEYFMSYRVREKLDSVLSFATDIVMDRDLNDLSYLYMYGEYIGENEIKFAEFLNKLPEEKIEAMASTYTEGFRLGFEAARIDMSKKKTVNIRYAIGQERMVRAAIKQFRAMGLELQI